MTEPFPPPPGPPLSTSAARPRPLGAGAIVGLLFFPGLFVLAWIGLEMARLEIVAQAVPVVGGLVTLVVDALAAERILASRRQDPSESIGCATVFLAVGLCAVQGVLCMAIAFAGCVCALSFEPH